MVLFLKPIPTEKAANTMNPFPPTAEKSLFAGTRAETNLASEDWTVQNTTWKDYGEYATSTRRK